VDATPPSGDAVDRVLTVPNVLSALRLLGVPVFLWLVLGPHHDRVAFVLLMVSGATDYLDGYLARRLHQVSRLGALLALTIRDVIPLWLLLVLVARDLYLAALLPVLRRHGYGPLPVSYLGKAATFNLLYAFPFLLLSSGHDALATWTRPIGWAFALWGTALYLYAAGLYTAQVRDLVADHPSAAAAAGGGASA